MLRCMKPNLLVLGGGTVLFGVVAYAAGFGGNMLALFWGPVAFVTGYLAAKFL